VVITCKVYSEGIGAVLHSQRGLELNHVGAREILKMPVATVPIFE